MRTMKPLFLTQESAKASEKGCRIKHSVKDIKEIQYLSKQTKIEKLLMKEKPQTTNQSSCGSRTEARQSSGASPSSFRHLPSLQPFQRELYRGTSECFSPPSGGKSPIGRSGVGLSSERKQIFINRNTDADDVYGVRDKKNSLETPQIAGDLRNAMQPQQPPYTPNANGILQSGVQSCPQLTLQLRLPTKENRDDYLLLSKQSGPKH